MSHESVITAVLDADATLVATLTGGIYTYGETKRLGIGRNTTPSAYGSGFLKPCAVVKARTLTPTYALRDRDTQFTATSQVVEIWLYNDGDSGYTAIETARDRIYALLQEQYLTGIVRIALAGQLDNLRDKELDNACVIRMDWQVRGEKST